MVVDSSAILSIFFNEENGPWVLDQLQAANDSLRMSTVNLAETLILIEDRQPQLAKTLKAKLLNSSIRFVAPDHQTAILAATARMKFPLNLGDCFAYALAKSENCPLLTLDRDFKATDIRVILPS